MTCMHIMFAVGGVNELGTVTIRFSCVRCQGSAAEFMLLEISSGIAGLKIRT